MTLRFLRSMPVMLCLADCAAVLAACLFAVLLRFAFDPAMPLSLYAEAFPRLCIFPMLYLSSGLYPGVFLRRPEELKRLSLDTSAGFLVLALSFFLAKEGASFSRAVLLTAWLFALVLVPFVRYLLRKNCNRTAWWGYPCILFGCGANMTRLCVAFSKAARQGLHPVVLVLPPDSPLPDCAAFNDRLRILRIDPEDEAGRASLEALAAEMPHAYAVVDLAGYSETERYQWQQCLDLYFQRAVIIPEAPFEGRIWVMAATIGDMPGLLLRQNLLDRRRIALKRGIDIALTLTSGILFFPLLCVLALAVRSDSRGPALFCQQRIGRNGKPFKVYKFRTMAVDAEERLAAYLAANEDARNEWAETQKLKDDPRVTRIGALLRKTSLDELPQLINVLLGDMSLVGPRPIVEEEISRYGRSFVLYTRVNPGITGLWQVSGRNDVSYEERIRLDRYYICNWSVWMDISIIVRTIPEVLHCSGAY